jgi:hypothetical protein
VLHGEHMDIVAIHSANLMVAIKPLVDWKNSSRRGEQGSHLAVENTHHRDLVSSAGGQVKTQKDQEKMTHEDLQSFDS